MTRTPCGPILIIIILYCVHVLFNVRCGCDESMLAALALQRASRLCHRGATVKPRPKLADWLIVHRSRQGSPAWWLTLPPVEYRWDLVCCMQDASGRAVVSQTEVGCVYAFAFTTHQSLGILQLVSQVRDQTSKSPIYRVVTV